MDQLVLIEREPLEPIGGEISISFKGEATKNHTISLDLYAQSLQGFHKAFAKANKDLLHFDVVIEIVGEKEGSVVAEIKYFAKVGARTLVAYSALASVLSFHSIQFDDVKSCAYNVFASTIQEIKLAKGSNRVLEERIMNSDLPEEEKRRYLALLKNSDFRIALDDVTFFLEAQGMEKIEISQGANTTTIHNYERAYFKSQPEDSEVVEEYHDTVSVISISKTDTWRFRGTKTAKEFNAEIVDENFLQNIRLHPASAIFKMNFAAIVKKILVTRAGKKKPDAPVYTINKLETIPEQKKLPLVADSTKSF